MVKNHLKKIATPRTWAIKRKDKNVFVSKPTSGPHNQNMSVPITVLFKTMLNIAYTTKEVKHILNNKTVKVNNVKRKDYKFPVGFLDVVEITELNKFYRIKLSKKGKLIVNEIEKKDTQFIYKLLNKTMVKGGKVQLNFSNGSNLLIDKNDYKTGDSLIVEEKKVIENFPLEKSAKIILTGGKHIGEVGFIDDIKGDDIIYKNETDKKVYETKLRYAFVIGNSTKAINI
jgi:small subunit ribosomal protein S4e